MLGLGQTKSFMNAEIRISEAKGTTETGDFYLSFSLKMLQISFSKQSVKSELLPKDA